MTARKFLTGDGTPPPILPTEWRLSLAVAAGSGIGGILRVAAARLMLPVAGTASFPFDVLAVNLAGSFLIGALAALTAPGGRWSVSLTGRRFLMAGLCGGFTTFSFFSLETLELLQAGNVAVAVLYSATTLAGAILAVAGGFSVGRRLDRATAPEK